MNWISRLAQITCLIFVSILCLNDALHYTKYVFLRHTHIRFEFCVPGLTTRTSTWSGIFRDYRYYEYYVRRTVMRDGIAAVTRRRFHFPLIAEEGKLGCLIFVNLTLTDGGPYFGNLTDHPHPYKFVAVDLLVVEVKVCNVTEDHTFTVGDNVTYACSVRFRGPTIKFSAMWSGPGLTSQKMLNYKKDRHPHHYGMFVSVATLRMTPNLDGTTRTFTIKNATGTSNYVFRTGVLTVKCPGYLWGPACDKDPISCRDVTCQNGAVCQDNETTRFFSCQCAASYVGTYCELEIVTNTTSVSTTAIVTKDATTPTGLSDEALVPFLSVLLVPPIGGVAVCGIIMCRRRIGTEEYEEGSEGSSGWIEDDLSSPSQAS